MPKDDRPDKSDTFFRADQPLPDGGKKVVTSFTPHTPGTVHNDRASTPKGTYAEKGLHFGHYHTVASGAPGGAVNGNAQNPKANGQGTWRQWEIARENQLRDGATMRSHVVARNNPDGSEKYRKAIDVVTKPDGTVQVQKSPIYGNFSTPASREKAAAPKPAEPPKPAGPPKASLGGPNPGTLKPAPASPPPAASKPAPSAAPPKAPSPGGGAAPK